MEDELHFVMECELFTIKDILEIDPNLKSDNKGQMLISLLSTYNCIIVKSYQGSSVHALK